MVCSLFVPQVHVMFTVCSLCVPMFLFCTRFVLFTLGGGHGPVGVGTLYIHSQ